MTPSSTAARAASFLGLTARVAAGVLWIQEGALKYQAGFGSADILLVANGTRSNPRTPFWFEPMGAVMSALPGAFGVLIPALEALLGAALLLGVFTRLAALGSIATLMLYWGSDQLIAQYPVMVLLAALVLALPGSARLGVPAWLRRRPVSRRSVQHL